MFRILGLWELTFFLDLTFFFSCSLGRVVSGKKHSIDRTSVRCRESQIKTRNPEFCGNASPIWGNSTSFSVVRNSMKHPVCQLTCPISLPQPTSLLHYLQTDHRGWGHAKKKWLQDKVTFKILTFIGKSRRCMWRHRAWKSDSTPSGLFL